MRASFAARLTGLAAPLIALCACTWGVDIRVSSNPALPAPNLVRNPGIEFAENGVPADWRWSTAVPENFVADVSSEGRSGKCIHLTAHSGIMSGYWHQSVPVEAGKPYVMTAWFRIGGGRLLAYVHAAGRDGPDLDERFYASSMRNHFLVPVFLKPEYMAGIDAESWHPIRIEFTPPGQMRAVAVSAGMYFQAGELWYDDFSVYRAETDLTIEVDAEAEGIVHVRVLAEDEAEPVFASGHLDSVERFSKTLEDVPTEERYIVEVTGADGSTHRTLYPVEVAGR